MTAQDPKVTVLDPIDGIRVVVREPSWACRNCGHEFGTVLRMRGWKNSEAINRLIAKWRSVQAILTKGGRHGPS
jgi:hypothetical protein